MNNKFNKSRVKEAVKKLIQFSAITHLSILFISAILESNIVVLNYFNILDIDFLFPGIIEGTASQVIALLTGFLIFVIIYAFFTNKE